MNNLYHNCIHEAGHAVAGFRFGIPIVEVSVKPQGALSGYVADQIKMEDFFARNPSDERMRTSSFRADFTAYLFAGAVAEWRILNGNEYSEEVQTGYDALWWLRQQRGADNDANDVRTVMTAASGAGQDERDLLTRAYELADDVVFVCRHAIRVVASQLYTTTCMDWRELRPIVKKAMG